MATNDNDDELLQQLRRLVQIREQELSICDSEIPDRKRPRNNLPTEEQPKAKRMCTNKPDEDPRTKRVLICGVWDMLHVGHVTAMKHAKALFPNTSLVVGGTKFFRSFC